MSGNDGRSPGTAGRDGNHTTFSLRRWSQRKHATAREAKSGARGPAPDTVAATTVGATAVGGASPGAPTRARVPAIAGSAADPVARVADPDARAERTARASEVGAPKLPPIETLTADSDFTPFMRVGVDPELRREALKKLLHDPRFNVMDGLDVYIDDYTKTKPIEPSLARELAARLHPRVPVGEHETADAAIADAAVADVAAADASIADVTVADAVVTDATVAGTDEGGATDAAPRDGDSPPAGRVAGDAPANVAGNAAGEAGVTH